MLASSEHQLCPGLCCTIFVPETKRMHLDDAALHSISHFGMFLTYCKVNQVCLNHYAYCCLWTGVSSCYLISRWLHRDCCWPASELILLRPMLATVLCLCRQCSLNNYHLRHAAAHDTESKFPTPVHSLFQDNAVRV